VTPVRERVMRGVLMALMVVALGANVAAADDGGTNVDYVPYDPGLPAVPYDPGLLQVPYDPGLLQVPYDPGLLTVPYDPGLLNVPYDPGLPSIGE
jgi:hypothetical protein